MQTFSKNRPQYRGNSSSSFSSKRNHSKKAKSLDPQMLIKKASGEEVKAYVSPRTIEQLPIHDTLKSILAAKGFTRPTEIQDKTIEALIERTDLLGIAQTGTGKTGAFLIPMIEHLIQEKTPMFGLIVVPTRELALQVQDEFNSMTRGLGLSSTSFIGGTSLGRDFQNLRRSVNVVIGTPGRLLDLANRGALDLSKTQTLVLDEFDRMLDMGFLQDVQSLISMMSARKHTMLFSATLDKGQQPVIDRILDQPLVVKINNGANGSQLVDQDIIRLKHGETKFDILLGILSGEEVKKVVIFEETRHMVDKLCVMLNSAGFKSEQIHGDKSQIARQSALTRFKQGKSQVLVATDVASRGIDVDNITHVINYQLPKNYDSYIHRIGRTGRAGKSGKAITLVHTHE